jgi:hypothetical protein
MTCDPRPRRHRLPPSTKDCRDVSVITLVSAHRHSAGSVRQFDHLSSSSYWRTARVDFVHRRAANLHGSFSPRTVTDPRISWISEHCDFDQPAPERNEDRHSNPGLYAARASPSSPSRFHPINHCISRRGTCLIRPVHRTPRPATAPGRVPCAAQCRCATQVDPYDVRDRSHASTIGPAD